MKIEFEPHSWYKHFAIQDTGTPLHPGETRTFDAYRWHGYTDNGNTYRIDELKAHTLKDLKQQITDYYTKQAERDAFNRARIGE